MEKTTPAPGFVLLLIALASLRLALIVAPVAAAFFAAAVLAGSTISGRLRSTAWPIACNVCCNDRLWVWANARTIASLAWS
jgi:hypothetical protein